MAHQLHDPPAPMRLPLIALAVPSVLMGVIGLSRDWLPDWLTRSVLADPTTGSPLADTPAALTPTLVTSALSTILVVVGGGAGWLAWRRAAQRDPATERGRLQLLHDGFYLDDVYELLVVRPTQAVAGLTARFDTGVIARAVRGSGDSSQRLGATVRRLQDGDIQRYLTVLLAGAVLMAVAAWTTVGR